MQRKNAIATASAISLVAITATATIALSVATLQRGTSEPQAVEEVGDIDLVADVEPDPEVDLAVVPAETALADFAVADSPPASGGSGSGPIAVAPAPAASAPAPVAPVPAAAPPVAPVPAAAPPVAPVPAASPAPTQTSDPEPEAVTYTVLQAGSAGTVTIQQSGDTLTFWSAATNPGWHYQVEKASGHEVKVKFRHDDGQETEFKVELDGSQLRVEL